MMSAWTKCLFLKAINFLVSGETGFVHGQVIYVAEGPRG